METTLHRQLKSRLGAEGGGRTEVAVGAFRADAVAADGAWVEVQSAALGPLREKLRRLLPVRAIRIIKPVVVERRIVRRERPDGPDLSARISPRRGRLADVFDDLVGLACIFPDPNLRVDVLAVAVDEVRVPRRRRPGYAVVDRRLRAVRAARTLHAAADLWTLLPDGLEPSFTTLEIAALLGRDIGFAQRVAYCLRLAGACGVRGKRGNRLVYFRDRTGAQSTRSSRHVDAVLAP